MIDVRPFRPEEWRAYRDVRLRALQADPGVFSSNFARESAYDDARWASRLGDPNTGVFGVFDGEQVIGMTGTWVSADDPGTVHLWGSWLEPAWRGRGISDAMYAARISWARAHATARRIEVSHRASNEASKRANQRHGFAMIGREPRTWPDGVTEDEVVYALSL